MDSVFISESKSCDETAKGKTKRGFFYWLKNEKENWTERIRLKMHPMCINSTLTKSTFVGAIVWIPVLGFPAAHYLHTFPACTFLFSRRFCCTVLLISTSFFVSQFYTNEHSFCDAKIVSNTESYTHPHPIATSMYECVCVCVCLYFMKILVQIILRTDSNSISLFHIHAKKNLLRIFHSKTKAITFEPHTLLNELWRTSSKLSIWKSKYLIHSVGYRVHISFFFQERNLLQSTFFITISCCVSNNNSRCGTNLYVICKYAIIHVTV